MNLFENMGDVNRGQEVKPLIAKWSKTGLMEGLRNSNEKSTVAVLLENQAKQLLKEGSATTAGTSGAGFEQWTGVALPLVRRVFAEIAAKEFVSVQPMNLPSGLVFYLDFKYGNNKRPFGYNPTGPNQTGTLAGITSASGAPTDGLYGAGRFGYSINTAVTASGATTASITDAVDVNFDGDFTGSLTSYRKLTYANFFSNVSNVDQYAVRSFVPVSGSTTLTAGTNYFPAFTKRNNNDLVFVVLNSAMTTGSITTAAVSFSLQPVNDNRNDFESTGVTENARSLDTNLNIPEI
jgi:hypothetical protein